MSDGKRVRITVTHMRTEQNYDKLYLTWDICDKGFHSYDTYWHGLHTINSNGVRIIRVPVVVSFTTTAQGDYDGSGRRSCKCNYVDFYK